MNKPKIKLSLSATASESAAETPTTTTEDTTSGGETTTDTETATADEGSSETEPATETEAKTVTTTPGAKTLADFRSAFGHEQGSVFFADQVPFVDACVKHMTAQSATITAQVTEITALKKTGTELAAKLKGEDEPVVTGQHGNGSGSGADPISAFAASAEQRMNKGK